MGESILTEKIQARHVSETNAPRLRLIVNGSRGRMTKRVRALARDDARFEILHEFGRCDESGAQEDTTHHGPIDIIIDFSTPEGAHAALALARAVDCALLVGTTGLPRQLLDELSEFARDHAIMIAPNTSLGAAALVSACDLVASALLVRADIDIIERHHVTKRDAPSGTAKRLAATIARARGSDLPDERIHVVRAGNIVGEHEVGFALPGEQLTLHHQVRDRDVFVRGALDAAWWLHGQPPGEYRIEHVLGLQRVETSP